MADRDQVPAAPSKFRRLVNFLLFVVVLASINIGGTWLTQQISFQLFPRHDWMLELMVLGSTLLFVVLMAIPFMPGIEIGLALMILLGSKGALLVYLCTVIALAISFVIGRRTSPI